MVWLTWLGLPLLGTVVGVRLGVAAGVAVLGTGIVGQLLDVRWLPRLSRPLGYGAVTDVPSAVVPTRGVVPSVTLYAANLCPFCPIVRRRLAELQRRAGFDVREIDVTFRPDVVGA